MASSGNDKSDGMLRDRNGRDRRRRFHVLSCLGICVVLFVFLKGPILESNHPILYGGLAVCVPLLYALVAFVDSIRMDAATGENPIDLTDTILEDDGDWTIVDEESDSE